MIQRLFVGVKEKKSAAKEKKKSKIVTKKRLFMAMPPALKKYWAEKRKKKKRKTTTRKRRTTRKGDLTLKRKKAFSPKSKRKSNKPRKKSNNKMKLPTVPKVLKKVAIGLGAATLAGMAVSFVAPQFATIARPVAALLGGGIPGIAAELIIDQGLLGNITSMFTGGGGINQQRLVSGL